MIGRRLLYKVLIVTGIALGGVFLSRLISSSCGNQDFSPGLQSSIDQKARSVCYSFTISETVPEKASKTRHKRGLHSKFFAVIFMSSKQVVTELVSFHYLPLLVTEVFLTEILRLK